MNTKLKIALLLSLISLILIGGGVFIYSQWTREPRGEFKSESKIESEELRKLIKKAQKHPENTAIQNKIAGFYLKRGKLQKSLAAADKTLNMDPENYMANHIKGRVYLEQGKTSKVIKEFKKVFEKTPENNSYHQEARDVIVRKLTEEALDMAENDKTEAALNKLNKILEVAPENYDVYFWKGLIYSRKWENEKARTELKKFIELAPEDSDKLKRAQKLLDQTAQSR